ncbi:MAG TPA: YfdX family protein [Aquifex sp.]|uniref:YfdX family protein n=1 Tax=Aquifex aeolicus TaxID=63363 RepID=A0A9D0YPI0_AQUAO|nr:YfdX family protein [Aquifex sp.]HIP98442.1 YfdX family protein [Aquifex aeolicus]
MVKKTALTIGLSLFLFTSFAGGTETQPTQGYSQALKTTVDQLKHLELSKIIKEASIAVWETKRVVDLLQKGDRDEALTALRRVYSLLEKLEREYGAKRFPVDMEFVEFSAKLDLEQAQSYNHRVKKLTEENDFVSARFLLNLLRDEIDIITTYLPLDVYKYAINLAIKLVENGKIKSAIMALESALSTLEVETAVVPKPPLKAQVLVNLAQKLYKIDPNSALKFVEKAQEEVKMAVALGYARSEKDLEPIIKTLTELRKAIKERLANVGEKFDETKQKLQELRKNLTVSY